MYMGMSEEEKKRWQEESKQLKADLDSRMKIIKKREVEIKFGNGSVKPKPSQKQPRPTQSTKADDDLLRRRLGL